MLEAERFVTHLPEEQRYGLGVAAFEVGSAYLRHDGLERLARPLVARVADATDGTSRSVPRWAGGLPSAADPTDEVARVA